MPQIMVYHFCITEVFIGVLKVTYLYLLHLPSLQNAIGFKKKNCDKLASVFRFLVPVT